MGSQRQWLPAQQHCHRALHLEPQRRRSAPYNRAATRRRTRSRGPRWPGTRVFQTRADKAERPHSQRRCNVYIPVQQELHGVGPRPLPLLRCVPAFFHCCEAAAASVHSDGAAVTPAALPKTSPPWFVAYRRLKAAQCSCLSTRLVERHFWAVTAKPVAMLRAPSGRKVTQARQVTRAGAATVTHDSCRPSSTHCLLATFPHHYPSLFAGRRGC